MAKTWTYISCEAEQAVRPDSFNKNLEKYLGEFNGNLNGNNLPVDGITEDHFVFHTVPETDVSGGGIERTSSRTATQAYYDSYRASWASSDIWTPLTSIDLSNDNWRRGWNRLDSFSGWETLPMPFTAREGMLVGCATIDWHHGINRITYDTFGTYWTGYQWWTEWGVFVNNVLVARSGWIMPRRHTTSLPFSIPVGSQEINIDVRFIANNTRDTIHQATSDVSTKLDIFSAEVWARNVYR
jgi:hypothetical protein